jgi:hypothetical protein
MHISYIEHFVARAKLSGLVGIELVEIAERKAANTFALATETVKTD